MDRPPPLLDALHADGFAIVPGLLGAAEVAALRAALPRLEARATAPGADPRRLVTAGAPPRLQRVVWCEGLDPAFDGLGADPRYVGLARAALGTTGPIDQLLQQLHPKVPGGGLAYAPHQDASNRRYGTPLWQEPGPQGGFVQIVTALDAADADSGGLRVWPGSHRRGFVAEPGTGRLPPRFRRPEDARDLTLQPGDALVFGPFLVHGSPPNDSDRPRTLFIQGYALPGVNRRAYPGSGAGVRRGR